MTLGVVLNLQASLAAETGLDAGTGEVSSLIGRMHVLPARFWRPRELKEFTSRYRLEPATGQAENCSPRIEIRGTGNLYVIGFENPESYLLVDPNHFDPRGLFECNDDGNPFEFLNPRYEGCLYRRWRAESPESVVMEVKLAKIDANGDVIWTSGRWIVTERFVRDGQKLTNRRNYIDRKSECTYTRQ